MPVTLPAEYISMEAKTGVPQSISRCYEVLFLKAEFPAVGLAHRTSKDEALLLPKLVRRRNALGFFSLGVMTTLLKMVQGTKKGSGQPPSTSLRSGQM